MTSTTALDELLKAGQDMRHRAQSVLFARPTTLSEAAAALQGATDVYTAAAHACAIAKLNGAEPLDGEPATTASSSA